jgi:hypothetical protein
MAVSETVTSNYIIYPDEHPNFHIGSYKGLLFFTQGYIDQFNYYINDEAFTASGSQTAPANSECEWW